MEQINLVKEKEFVHVFLNNKTEYLLLRYRQSGDRAYLNACLNTARLTDSVIKSIRHEQKGEQSKLFWRNRTREFFTNAIEACFVAKDPQLAFHFMESSRSVILGDKVNELGAYSFLPGHETLQEQKIRTVLVDAQQNLLSAEVGTEEHTKAQFIVLEAKEKLERFIKGLEKKYPSYYQYKYADAAPSLSDMKKYLSTNKQSFVHYFIGDTMTYVLGISENEVKMLRVGKNLFDVRQITELMTFLSDKELLNRQFPRFVSLSYQLNKTLYAPLQLPKGRVVICPDNFLLPFEALSSDVSGKRVLIDDYAFSYIYSGSYLLKHFREYPSTGNFIGFAPVSFSTNLGLADLKNSAVSSSDVAGNYDKTLLYTAANATKQNFLSHVGSYKIANIFSHARVDDEQDEPMLYMQDSIIRLSELQYLTRPSTSLVVLSACQTTAGKNATGEGIYSLARGFAAAGIPAVAATIWKADEETIYSISKIFHQYLSKGMRKDEALQKAKLEFINTASRERLLPYYWANMIIMGNPEEIKLNKPTTSALWIIVPVLGIVILLVLFTVFLPKSNFLKQRAKNAT